MGTSSDLLQRVYDASNGGLAIIREILPGLDEAVIDGKKAFKLRPDERTPSAHLYPPDTKRPYWHVKDYGMGEGDGFFSPIDLYLWDRGYGQDKFRLALEELAERYGVQEVLSASVNKPEMEKRDARPEELGAAPRISLIEGFGGIDLSCWGTDVKAEHMETYGWQAVSEVAITSGDKVFVRKATSTYPIFAQKCDYVDEQGQPQAFHKVYEPRNPDKAHRFLIVGKKPQNYIYGLNAVRRQFQDQGEEKLPVLLLVSGGSDAICALSKGYLAIWLDSEVKGLSEADYGLLLKYAHRIVNIPDIDATGITAGRRLALNILGIYTAWLTADDMGGVHDNRGRLCKDLRDYCRLNPHKKAMEQLIARAKCAKFWKTVTDKQGQKEYHISCSALNYFLELNGFCTLKDDSRMEPVYIRITGIRVQHITHKTIKSFLQTWMEQQGLPQALQDKVLRSRDLPCGSSSSLREREDLDFRKGTATAQYFHFRNCWVEVTRDGIIQHRYTDPADHFIWEENIIPHDYRVVKDMFKVGTDAEGHYVVTITEGMELSKYFQFQVNSCRLHWRKEDEEGLPLTIEEMAEDNLNLTSRLTNLGYMLYSHKSESEAWATNCLDSTLAESPDECNGRSGKSFHINAISKMVKTFKIDARTTPTRDNRFLFDGITPDTDLVFVDECPKSFDFNFFYGQITNDLRVEEKNRHSFVVPFAQSPKFALATNFAPTRHDPSTEGRMWPQVFSDYYHVRTPKNNYRETRTIRDDFGQNLMGTEYSETDWQLDFAFMLQCLRLYLSLEPGKRKIMPPLTRIERREQLAAVGKDFKQWADEYFAPDSGHLDCELKAETVLAEFNQETKFGWSPKRLTQHLDAFCQLAEHIHCLNPATITHKEKDGERWIKRDESALLKTYYYVQSARAVTEPDKVEPVQTSMDF